MSYGRNPHYIWSDGECMDFDGTRVLEEVLNAFLYKILLTNRREELAERLRQGKSKWMKPVRMEVDWQNGDWSIVDAPEDDSERLATIKWMESCEDDVLKRLMGV